ncbi:DUF1510 family protein [Terrilactibacillus sp. BCM23-1]|uniref:DUF1510 family protein n=1 Tax=Terrilactibacillus tamarindi TaxID=2599694 RepID=A0A6N8CVT2_9BACI|nr:YrrS family protein [Terrilactibacillus tamarindi]MTT32466.1 DUF1510 family protein [Terrilactibacillus tamarindi]
MRTDKSPSRSSRHKRTSDRALKWSISIVSILILAVGCIFVAMLLKTSSEESAPTHQQVNDKHISSNTKDTKNDPSSKNDDNRAPNNPDETTDNSSDTSDEESNESNDPSTEDHVTSYDKGTADWNAQIKAMSEATGIPESNMTVYWLGNGGGPNSSLGRVAPKDAPSQKYVVHLEYKNGKWEAESVKKPSE